MDGITSLKKNQTAKVLEKFFYTTSGRDYVSVIPDEEEVYDKPPELNEIKENADRIIPYIKILILNADRLKDIDLDEKTLKEHTCGLDPVVDKILAINIADILNRNIQYADAEQLTSVWITSIEKLKEDWNEPLKPNTVASTSSYEVDTSNLKVGMVVKGYKVLCELLHEKPLKSGNNSHKAQQKRWARYFKWEKGRGRSLVILEIYDEPLPVDDKRKNGNRSIYLKYIETILLKYISYKKGQVCYATRNQLWSILGMINSHYKKIPLGVLQMDFEYSDVTKWELDNFYMRCNAKLNSVLFTALNNLSNRSLISYQIQTMIVIPNKDKKNALSKHCIATDTEIRYILAAERKVLNCMNLESKNHAACTMRLNEFYDKVNEELHELYGWERKYERIKIIFNEKDVGEAIEKNEYELHMMYLNQLIVDAINKNAETVSDNRMKKALQEYDMYVEEWKKTGYGKPPALEQVDDIFTYPKYYVDIQRKLSRKFLSLKQEDTELDELFESMGVE